MDPTPELIKIQFNCYIDTLLDPEAETHEKDDAAMDLEFEQYRLGPLYDQRAVEALIYASMRTPEDDITMLATYGETIGTIWAHNNNFDLDAFKKLPGHTQFGIFCSTKSTYPEWVEQYKKYENPVKDEMTLKMRRKLNKDKK